jgi:hypothetical protein
MDLVHEEAKTPIHDLVNRFRVEVFKHGRRVGNIREEDRDELPLSLDGTASREDFISEMLWSVRMRLVIIQGLGFFRFAEIMAAFIAEGSAGVIRVRTARALQLNSFTALLAKLGSFSIVEPAFHAFHSNSPPLAQESTYTKPEFPR